jgi:hypothetical protein
MNTVTECCRLTPQTGTADVENPSDLQHPHGGWPPSVDRLGE